MRRHRLPARLLAVPAYPYPVLTGALLAVALLLTSCAGLGKPCRTPAGDPDLTPSVAATSPDHEGRQVTWGGTLVEVRNRETATELEVVAWPLDRCGRPQAGGQSLGRFIIVRPGYLEGADLTPGRAVTATGTIAGVREGRIGDTDYRFPLLAAPDPVTWPTETADEVGRRGWRPGVSIGIGGGWGSGGWNWSGGGIGVHF